jgi:ribosomal protein S6--L-glutamate ligase
MKKPYSAQTVLIAHNKFMSLDILRKAGVPIPTTYLISSVETAKIVLKKMKYPIVVKIVGGYGGVGVMMFESKEAALSAIQTLKLLKQQIIIEEFIQNAGEDIRAFVVNGEVAASMKRVAKEGEIRANLLQGGQGKYITLTGEMEDVALKAASAIASDIIAIDIIESTEGPKVIEVNLNPGIKGIKSVSNKNIAKVIIDFIASEMD